MRTLVWGTLALLLLVAAPAVADPQDDARNAVDAAVDRLNLKLRDAGLPNDGDTDETAPQPQPQATIESSGLLEAVLVPLTAATDGLVDLGLHLLAGFFTGIAKGAATVGVAASVVASTPVQSTILAVAGATVAGLASLLWAALKRYGSLGALPLFSRIAKSELLENKTRSDVFELIRANPGINVSEISRRLDVAWGTATHHLQKLRAERLVGIRVVGHQKCYFPNGGTYTPHEMDVMGAVKNGTARKIAEFLSQRGPLCHNEVSQGLDLSPALVTFHMKKLVDAGVVGRQREGRRTIFTPLDANLSPAPRPMMHTV